MNRLVKETAKEVKARYLTRKGSTGDLTDVLQDGEWNNRPVRSTRCEKRAVAKRLTRPAYVRGREGESGRIPVGEKAFF